MFNVIEQGGESALPSPVFGFVYHSRGGTTFHCVWFCIEFSMAFEGGDGVRSPPLSGGSKLNNFLCGVEKKNRAPSVQ